MKELEKARMQLEQMQEYKARWQEAQRDLQAQLNATKKVSHFKLFSLVQVFEVLSYE